MKKNSYLMPAEWQPQAALWVSWPHNVETWPENLPAAQAEFVAFVQTVAKYQPVKVLCAGEAKRQAETGLAGIGNVELVDIATNDAWARDYAPTFVVRQNGEFQERGLTLEKEGQTPFLKCQTPFLKLVVIDWLYNAWGGKYPPFDDDQRVARLVAEKLGVDCVSPDLCFEGGAIEGNDLGLMLCTLSCALDPNRNPGKTQTQIEDIFIECLGAKEFVWLSGDAIEGDDTDGHIDQLARFTDDRTIVYAWCDDSEDRQFVGLQKNLGDLKSGLAGLGHEDFQLIPLPIPAEINLHDRRVPASYCNFLICNGLVVVPQFGDAKYDAMAMEILTPLFPGREVIGLNSVNLSVGLGSFHCLSQQQPAEEITRMRSPHSRLPTAAGCCLR